MIEIEFWPEYGSGPLWLGGVAVEPGALLDGHLAARLTRWNDAYADGKLPIDGCGDLGWISEGRELLASVRQQLASTHAVVATEPWWD